MIVITSNLLYYYATSAYVIIIKYYERNKILHDNRIVLWKFNRLRKIIIIFVIPLSL